MARNTKKHALRPCCRNGCSDYPVAICDSWDKDQNAVCERPVCARHVAVVGNLDFCPKHHPHAGASVAPKESVQASLFGQDDAPAAVRAIGR